MEMYAAQGYMPKKDIAENMKAWNKKRAEMISKYNRMAEEEKDSIMSEKAEEEWWDYVERTTKDYDSDLYRNRFSKIRKKWMVYNSIQSIKESGILKEGIEESSFMRMIEDYNEWIYNEERGYYIHPLIETVSSLINKEAERVGCHPREVGIKISN